MAATFKAVRTDRELECPDIDAGLRARGCDLVLLGDGVSEDELVAAVHDADLLLMCYTPVTARVIAGAAKLKGIVKYGVGIDAIDIAAAMARGIPVVNVPEYAEETVAEGAFALVIALAKKLMPIGRVMPRMAGPGRRRNGSGLIWRVARLGLSEPAGSVAAWRGWPRASACG